MPTHLCLCLPSGLWWLMAIKSRSMNCTRCYSFREVENKHDLNLDLQNSWKVIKLEAERSMRGLSEWMAIRLCRWAYTAFRTVLLWCQWLIVRFHNNREFPHRLSDSFCENTWTLDRQGVKPKHIKLHYDLCSSPNITQLIDARKLRWAAHAPRMRETESPLNILVKNYKYLKN
jgi:hypothetical protein